MKEEISENDLRPKIKIGLKAFGGEMDQMWDYALINNLTGEVSMDKQGIYKNAKIVYINQKPAWFCEKKEQVIQWITEQDMIDACPFLENDEIEALKRWDASLETKHRRYKVWYQNVVTANDLNTKVKETLK